MALFDFLRCEKAYIFSSFLAKKRKRQKKAEKKNLDCVHDFFFIKKRNRDGKRKGRQNSAFPAAFTECRIPPAACIVACESMAAVMHTKWMRKRKRENGASVFPVHPFFSTIIAFPAIFPVCRLRFLFCFFFFFFLFL